MKYRMQEYKIHMSCKELSCLYTECFLRVMQYASADCFIVVLQGFKFLRGGSRRGVSHSSQKWANKKEKSLGDRDNKCSCKRHYSICRQNLLKTRTSKLTGVYSQDLVTHKLFTKPPWQSKMAIKISVSNQDDASLLSSTIWINLKVFKVFQMFLPC